MVPYISCHVSEYGWIQGVLFQSSPLLVLYLNLCGLYNLNFNFIPTILMLRLTLILTLNQYEPILSRKRIMFVIGT